jgi:flavodoxin
VSSDFKEWSTKLSCVMTLFLFSSLMGGPALGLNRPRIQTVLILVDPGFSKFSLEVARRIQDRISAKGIAVKLIPVGEFKAEDLHGMDLIVIGGPTYAGQPSPKIKKLLAELAPIPELRTLLFSTGGSDGSGLEPLTRMAGEKGLLVLGGAKFIQKPDEAPELDLKIRELLEVI